MLRSNRNISVFRSSSNNHDSDNDDNDNHDNNDDQDDHDHLLWWDVKRDGPQVNFLVRINTRDHKEDALMMMMMVMVMTILAQKHRITNKFLKGFFFGK